MNSIWAAVHEMSTTAMVIITHYCYQHACQSNNTTGKNIMAISLSHQNISKIIMFNVHTPLQLRNYIQILDDDMYF